MFESHRLGPVQAIVRDGCLSLGQLDELGRCLPNKPTVKLAATVEQFFGDVLLLWLLLL